MATCLRTTRSANQIVASSVFSEGMDLEHIRANPASRLKLAALYDDADDDYFLAALDAAHGA